MSDNKKGSSSKPEATDSSLEKLEEEAQGKDMSSHSKKKYKKPKIEVIKLNDAVVWSAGY